ncbi:uncharacterized protein LOC144359432 [Saccoglossus kowalevskii]
MRYSSTMWTPIVMMVTIATVIMQTIGGVNVTDPRQRQQKSTKIVPRTIRHPTQAKTTWTGNDVFLRGITELDFRLPIAKYSISWTKDNKKITYLETTRVYFENKGLHLRINDVRVSDAGRYEFVIIYLTIEDQQRTAIREITDIVLSVNDDGDVCSDSEIVCKGYCIPSDQQCTNETTSLGLVIGAVVGGVIVLLTCILLFLLSRRGRNFCKRESGFTRSDGGLCEAALSATDDGTPCTSRRNGTMVSFAAKPIVQIYEREDEYTSDSGGCGSDGEKPSSPNYESNGDVSCKTTTV